MLEEAEAIFELDGRALVEAPQVTGLRAEAIVAQVLAKPMRQVEVAAVQR